MATIKVNK